MGRQILLARNRRSGDASEIAASAMPPMSTSDDFTSAPTLFLLMAQYNGKTVVPIDQVCRDFFGHLAVDKLLREALRGDIALPIVRIETSQKARRGVFIG